MLSYVSAKCQLGRIQIPSSFFVVYVKLSRRRTSIIGGKLAATDSAILSYYLSVTYLVVIRPHLYPDFSPSHTKCHLGWEK